MFADIGCDHGYCTRFALRNGLCKKAYACDISDACLAKARTLLEREIADGTCIPVCSDGLDGPQAEADCVLIAGMGGEETVRILSGRPLPAFFVLQPMKNTQKVRRFLLPRGARLHLDVTFAEGNKFYDLLTGEGTGGDAYSEFEYRYGRNNLKTPSHAFFRKLKKDIGTLRRALRSAAGEQRERLLERLHEAEGIADAIEENI